MEGVEGVEGVENVESVEDAATAEDVMDGNVGVELTLLKRVDTDSSLCEGGEGRGEGTDEADNVKPASISGLTSLSALLLSNDLN